MTAQKAGGDLDPAETAQNPAATDQPDTSDQWLRLDPRMLLIRPARELVRFLPVLIIAFVVGAGGADDGSAWRERWGLITTGIVVLYGMLHWFTTRYRIGPEQVELRTGLLRRRHLGVPRDRIRTVDMKADVLHRVFRLTALKIGTGQQQNARSKDRLMLDALSATEAQRIRTTLLHRPDLKSADDAGTVTESGVPATKSGVDTELARLDPRWLRYAPFTLSGLAALAAATGALAQLFNEFRLFGLVRSAYAQVQHFPVALVAASLVITLFALVTVLSTVGYLLSYWNFKLTREPGGTLHIERGLLTHRSVSIEERRLRGAELKETLPLRLVRGVKTVALAAGLQHGGEGGSERSSGSILLPPAPLTEARRVVAAVLHEPFDPTGTPLIRHPVAALRRRLTRAIGSVLFLAAVFGALWAYAGWPAWLWEVCLVLVPFAAFVGWDRYRALGHALTERYVHMRHGSIMRTTTAVRRDGVIGWRMDRSFFQRRSGVVTIHAVTATMGAAHPMIDIREEDGIELISDATPGLLSPFVERKFK